MPEFSCIQVTSDAAPVIKIITCRLIIDRVMYSCIPKTRVTNKKTGADS